MREYEEKPQSQKVRGTFWDQFTEEEGKGEEENLEGTAQHLELEKKTENRSDSQTANASDNAPSHRRIVSDPPPLESWHLNEIE